MEFDAGTVLGSVAFVVAVIGVASIFFILFKYPNVLPKGKTTTIIVPPQNVAPAGSPGACLPVPCTPQTGGDGTVPWSHGPDGTVTFSGPVTFNGDLTVTGDLGAETCKLNSVRVTGNQTVNGGLTTDTLTTTGTVKAGTVVTSTISPVNSELTINGSVAITKFMAVNTSQTNPYNNGSTTAIPSNLGYGTIAAFYDKPNAVIQEIGHKGSSTRCWSSSDDGGWVSKFSYPTGLKQAFPFQDNFSSCGASHYYNTDGTTNK